VNGPVAATTPSFPGFPLGVTVGSYDQTFDLTSAATYNNPSFETALGGTVASEEAALLTTLASDETYLNIHSSVDPAGEIRGILALEAPEPGTFLLAGACLAGIWFRRRRR